MPTENPHPEHVADGTLANDAVTFAVPPEEPPGMPVNAYDLTSIRNEVQSSLDHATGTVDQVVSALKAPVEQAIGECDQICSDCEVCLTGHARDAISAAEAIANKCAGKLAQQAQVFYNQASLLLDEISAKVPGLPEAIAASTMDLSAQHAPQPVEPALTPHVGSCPPGDLIGSCPPGATPAMCVGNTIGACAYPNPFPTPQPPPVPPPQPQPTPQPPPQPPGEGQCITWQQDGNGKWVCIQTEPGPQPPPESGGNCPVILPPTPPPPPPPPPCPPPDIPCPPGQSMQWDGKFFRCLPTPPTPPPEPPTGTQPGTVTTGFGYLDWNQLICPAPFPPALTTTAVAVQSSYDIAIERIFWNVEKPLTTPTGSTIGDGVQQAIYPLVEMVKYLIKGVGDWSIQQVLGNTNCAIAGIIGPWASRALLGFVEKWTHIGFEDLVTTLSYTIDRACPTLLPGQSGIDQAYLANQISHDTWKCWTRAVNDLDVPAHAVMYSSRAQPSASQWIAAWQRGMINENDLSARLRGVGVLDKFEGEVQKALMFQIPGPGDLVRFMLRDVEDPNVVIPFNLDDEFNQKFVGTLRDGAAGQGLSEDWMRRYWRAHWQWPSPSQMYEMLFRLRPDSLDPTAKALAVDAALVEKVLSINDVVEPFRKRLVAIAYRLPRIMDVKKLFFAGLWGTEQLLDYYKSYGYSPNDAETKVKFDTAAKLEDSSKKARLVSKSKVVSAFVKGAIGPAEFDAGMEFAGLDPAQRSESYRQAVYLKMIAQRDAVLKAVKCQFMSCGLNPVSAVSALISAGWNSDDAGNIVACWKQKCELRPKQITASLLCKWYGNGLISQADYRSRLYALGFSRTDVERIIAECEIELAQKAAKKGSKSGATNSTAGAAG